jgi:hypothetical protein
MREQLVDIFPGIGDFFYFVLQIDGGKVGFFAGLECGL